jgi:hypothetical protein
MGVKVSVAGGVGLGSARVGAASDPRSQAINSSGITMSRLRFSMGRILSNGIKSQAAAV